VIPSKIVKKGDSYVRPAVLSGLPYLQQLNPQQLEDIAPLIHELSVERGNILFSEGEPCKGLYFVVEGSIKVSRVSPEGRDQVLAVVGRGQTFNDVPVFDGGPCPATATALEGSVVGLIPMDLMHRLVRRHWSVAEGMLTVFASRLRGLVSLVADLTHLDVTGRVAKVLIAYHSASGQSGMDLGQQDLASIVGSTREVVSRSLRSLEEQGAIVRKSRGLEVISSEKLAAVLGGKPRKGV